MGLARAIAAPVVLDQGTLSIQASIGVATTPTATCTPTCYATQTRRCTRPRTREGRCSATRLSWTAAAERFALVADLRLALDRDELLLRFQPKVDLRTGQVTGAEALVRGPHSRLVNMERPASFR